MWRRRGIRNALAGFRGASRIWRRGLCHHPRHAGPAPGLGHGTHDAKGGDPAGCHSAARRLRCGQPATVGRAARTGSGAHGPGGGRYASAAGNLAAVRTAARSGRPDRQFVAGIVSRKLGTYAREPVAGATIRLDRRGCPAHVCALRKRDDSAGQFALEPHRPRDGSSANRGAHLRRNHRAPAVTHSASRERRYRAGWQPRSLTASIGFASNGAAPCAPRSSAFAR